jgi:hypothetical protein
MSFILKVSCDIKRGSKHKITALDMHSSSFAENGIYQIKKDNGETKR